MLQKLISQTIMEKQSKPQTQTPTKQNLVKRMSTISRNKVNEQKANSNECPDGLPNENEQFLLIISELVIQGRGSLQNSFKRFKKYIEKLKLTMQQKILTLLKKNDSKIVKQQKASISPRLCKNMEIKNHNESNLSFV
ncbi:UNKNOWN [Stylonychia lemnae]|uniref:Uncharacterized protein n=1 Tax=Stylonychia lemnae TaxID=5949 RepID=A0A078B0E4_STYLE|nr:UNKNOWN [Stylonychia lemnae]|eukprot:CDW87781.1 UNKNOWN [Stylonychia lemnae]